MPMWFLIYSKSKKSPVIKSNNNNNQIIQTIDSVLKNMANVWMNQLILFSSPPFDSHKIPVR